MWLLRGGEGRRLMEKKNILNFHFDYFQISLIWNSDIPQDTSPCDCSNRWPRKASSQFIVMIEVMFSAAWPSPPPWPPSPHHLAHSSQYPTKCEGVRRFQNWLQPFNFLLIQRWYNISEFSSGEDAGKRQQFFSIHDFSIFSSQKMVVNLICFIISKTFFLIRSYTNLTV